MNEELLKEYIDGVAQQNLNVRGIVVRRHGEIIASHDFVPSERIQLFSASKSFTSIAVGLAIGEGYLKLTDKYVDLLADILPAKLPDGYEKITLWHLLTMSTGHSECPIFKMQNKRREEAEKRGEKMPGPGAPGAGGPGRGGNMADEWFDTFVSEPLTHEPGTFYAYNNGASYMLSIIVHKKTGMSLVDYLKPRFFDPLGIKDPVWQTDSKGYCLGAIGLHLTTEELSRAGQLLLNGGKWEGKQLIPAEYVAQMTTKQIDTFKREASTPVGAYADATMGYGFQVWMCAYPEAYRMDGMMGQFSIGLPTLDAVVAITSQQAGFTGPILQLVWDTLTPKLEKMQ